MADPGQPDQLLERLRAEVAPDYTVERLLGQGGMGVVYLGHDVRLNRPVALKVLKLGFETATFGQRFLREAQSLARCSSPHVVSVYRVAPAKSELSYYIMEYIDGPTLEERLNDGPLDTRSLRALVHGLLTGLADVHRLKIVHRDIKPSNIFLTDRRVVISDFGIARWIGDEQDTALTQPGSRIGTLHFMSPEQQRGLEVDHRSDLYSAGIVLFEAASGWRWPSEQVQPAESAEWAAVPRRLRWVIQKALQESVDQRWQSADELLSATGRLGRPRSLALRGAVALGVLVAILFGLGRIIFPPGPICLRPNPTDIAFRPFATNEASPGLSGEDFSNMVRADADWFGRLKVTPPPVVSCWLEKDPQSFKDARATRVLNTRFVVFGLPVRQPGGPVLRLTIRDSQPDPRHVITVPGNPNDIYSWAQAAADSVVRRVFPEHWNYYITLRGKSHPSDNPRAYSEYFKGERAFQADAYNFARTQYEAAVLEDSNLVQAKWRLGIVYRFLRLPFEDYLARLYRDHSSELPEQDRRLIKALIDPDLPHRFAQYRRIVDSFPNDPYVRFVYADELFHRGPLVGYPLDSALAEFKVVAAMEPGQDQVPAYDHLIYGYLRLGDRAEADSALAQRLRLPPSKEVEEQKRRQFFKFAYDERFVRWPRLVRRWYFETWADSSTLSSMNRFVRLGTSFDIPATQVILGGILARSGLDREALANGHRAEGLGLMMMGRPTAALPELDSAATAWGKDDSLLERAEWRVLPGVLGLPGVAPADQAWGVARLEALAGPGTVGSRANWALAVEAYSRGDTALAETLSARIMDPHAGRLRALVGALQQAARGRQKEALASSDTLQGYEVGPTARDPFARSVLYLNRMRWQLALNDTTAAEATRHWYLNSDSGIEGWPQRELEPGEVDVLLGVYLRLLQAEADRRAGRVAAACSTARRVRELWNSAEASYDELRARAAQAAEGCSP
jgi:serine/threonine protein kinase/tetratricopeptide (TPR) repeat protein